MDSIVELFSEMQERNNIYWGLVFLGYNSALSNSKYNLNPGINGISILNKHSSQLF